MRFLLYLALCGWPVAALCAPAKTPTTMPVASLQVQLSRAIAANDAAAVARLMKRGARPSDSTLELALYSANLATWRALLDGGLSLNTRVNSGEDSGIFDKAPLIVAVASLASSDETQSVARALLRELLARGADANARGQKGTTALQAATQNAHDNGQSARILLDAGARVAPDDAWLLQSAAKMGALALLQRALELGVQADSKAARGQHLLQAALDIRGQSPNEDTPIFEARDANARLQIARLLIDAGAPINDLDELGQTLIMFAADGSLRPATVELLLKRGADPNLRAANGPTIWDFAVPSRFYTKQQIDGVLNFGMNDMTLLPSDTSQPLTQSVENTRTLELLLDAGANIEQPNARGLTPLMLAAQNNRALSIAFLTGCGAKVDATDKAGNAALHVAAGTDSPDAVAALLDAGASINARTQNGLTPLLMAAGAGVQGVTYYGPLSMTIAGYVGGPEALQMLVARGADTNATDNQGATTLHYIAAKRDTKSAQLLIKSGANVNARAQNGITALHIAAREGDYSLAKLLLQLGADATLKVEDKTALDIAREPYVTQINVGANPSRETRKMMADLRKSDAQKTARRQEIARLLERTRGANK